MPLPLFSRWHLTSQDRLFRQLRAIWSDDVPRVMVDIGCHAGHTWWSNVSDAMLWLRHFNASGGTVLGVDVVEDYALDLAARLAREPFRSLSISMQTLTLAIGEEDGRMADMTGVLKGAYESCLGSWYKPWEQIELSGHLDFFCRIPRQRAAVGAASIVERRSATLPLPPAKLLPGLGEDGTINSRRFTPKHLRGYRVPTSRVDTLWREHLGGVHIDFLKIDIDMSWREMGLEGLIARRGFSALVIEVDASWGFSARWGVSDVDQLSWFAHRHGYHPYLKVPCVARPHAVTPADLERGYASTYHSLLDANGKFAPTMYHTKGTHGQWGIQDVLLLDFQRQPQLGKLVRRSKAQCRTLPTVAPVAKRSTDPPGFTTILREWLNRSSSGFCAITDAAHASDCERDDKGVLGLLPMDAKSEQSAARACLIRCASCARCRYITVSLRHGDCSWYANCNLATLDQSIQPEHFLSGPAVLPMQPRQTRNARTPSN
eukprot:6581514-Prymnesium_polylepis.1